VKEGNLKMHIAAILILGLPAIAACLNWLFLVLLERKTKLYATQWSAALFGVGVAAALVFGPH